MTPSWRKLLFAVALVGGVGQASPQGLVKITRHKLGDCSDMPTEYVWLRSETCLASSSRRMGEMFSCNSRLVFLNVVSMCLFYSK
jgi:hypothetical protein